MGRYFDVREEWTALQIQSRLQGRFVIGFSGYTKPPRDSGYMERAAETVEDVLACALKNQAERAIVLYGCSDAGIDQIVESACRAREMPILGITCAEFAEWVPDEAGRPPVLVAESEARYGELFANFLDLLVITGGRDHTIRYDLQVLRRGKPVVVADCAPEAEGFCEGRIANAAALLRTCLRFDRDWEDVLRKEPNR